MLAVHSSRVSFRFVTLRHALGASFFGRFFQALRARRARSFARGPRTQPHLGRHALAFLILLFAMALGACEGCRTTGGPDGSSPRGAPEEPATARLYLISDLAGALEPCGCVKDQLGGMDHFGALVGAEKSRARGAGVLSAGPLFFMDMQLAEERRGQEIKKAETIATSLKSLGLLAFAPGRNDWAAGPEGLAKLAELSGGSLVAANLQGPPESTLVWARSTLKDVGGIKVGIVGVSAPDKAKEPLSAISSSAAAVAVKSAFEALKNEGAQAVVALAAVGRGEAKRIADENPDLLAIVVGSTGGGGEANTKAPPAERVGDVLIAETGNHLQTVATLDLYLQKNAGPGLVKFADGTGIERIRKGEELNARLDELRARVAVWEKDKSIDKRDIDARKADIARLEAERDTLLRESAKAAGSYYRYSMREVRDNLGASDSVKAQMLAYYKHVNDANKVAFADRKPKEPAKGEPSYVGIDTCSACHDDARRVWDKTAHPGAYATLAKQFKEFNLDCVSCHVTGYDRPGGSTVTHVDRLKDVQCEACHGPGSLHVSKPDTVKVPIAKPSGDVCLSCHHPPHVHSFDPATKMREILGPGHGAK